MKAGKSATFFSDINITPLTDIFLVLLIIMMVVAPMMQQMRADIKPPDVTAGSSMKQNALTVEVTQKGEYFVNGEATPETALTEKLTALKGSAKDKNVIIRADKATRSAAVLRVLEAARDAQYEKVTVSGQNHSNTQAAASTVTASPAETTTP